MNSDLCDSDISYLQGLQFARRHSKHIKITNNMSGLLHCLLTSSRFLDGRFMFQPTPSTQQILDTYTRFDIIDTYSRLKLNNKVYGDNLVNKSQSYVILKMRKAYNRKYWRDNKNSEKVK